MEQHHIEFYRKHLHHWQTIRHQASIDGDFKAWEFANREVENYTAMLKTVGVSVDDVVDT